MYKPIKTNEKLYNKIMIQIQNLIITGELQPGDKLPPEREMAVLLGVSRPALKQALCALEAMGIINCQHGSGNIIKSMDNNLLNPFVFEYYTSTGNLNDILELRLIIEMQTIRIITLKYSMNEINLSDLEQICEKMKGITELDDRIHYNNLFHTTLVQLSENLMLSILYRNMIQLFSLQISKTDGINFYESHKKIIDGIKSKKPSIASTYIIEHFSNKFPNYHYYDVLKKE